MELGLRGRTAIVCGASAGIGLGCAEALAEAGANVVMFARRQDVLEREAVRLSAVPVAGDVRSADDLVAKRGALAASAAGRPTQALPD